MINRFSPKTALKDSLISPETNERKYDSNSEMEDYYDHRNHSPYLEKQRCHSTTLHIHQLAPIILDMNHRRIKMQTKKQIKKYKSIVFFQKALLLSMASCVHSSISMSLLPTLFLIRNTFNLSNWGLLWFWTLEPITEAIIIYTIPFTSFPSALFILFISAACYSQSEQNLILLLVARIAHGAGSGLLGRTLLQFGNEQVFHFSHHFGILLGPLLTAVFFEGPWISEFAFILITILFVIIFLLQIPTVVQDKGNILVPVQQNERPLIHFSVSFLYFAVLFDIHHLIRRWNTESTSQAEVTDIVFFATLISISTTAAIIFRYLLSKANMMMPDRIMVSGFCASLLGIFVASTRESFALSLLIFGFTYGSVDLNVINVASIIGGKACAPILVTVLNLLEDDFTTGTFLFAFCCLMLPLSFLRKSI